MASLFRFLQVLSSYLNFFDRAARMVEGTNQNGNDGSSPSDGTGSGSMVEGSNQNGSDGSSADDGSGGS